MQNPPAKRSQRQPRKEKPKAVVDKGTFYKAGAGKPVPDSKKVQEEANKKRVSTAIMHTEQTDFYAEAIVRAIHPSGSHYVDDIVHHDFNTIMQLKALELLEKQIKNESQGKKMQKIFEDTEQPFTPQGTPILTSYGTLKVLKDMTRFKNFSLRDAVTKARRRASLQVLNEEWRDKGEAQLERDEENMVTKQIAEEKGSEPFEYPPKPTKETTEEPEPATAPEPKRAKRTRKARTPMKARATPKTGKVDSMEDADAIINEAKLVTEDTNEQEVMDMTPDHEELAKGCAPLRMILKEIKDNDLMKTDDTILEVGQALVGTQELTSGDMQVVRQVLGVK